MTKPKKSTQTPNQKTTHCQNTNFKLRDYQREDCEFIKAHNSVGCFNEQRTGKTPTTIVSLAERNIDKVVVICPKTAVSNWLREWETWGNTPALALKGTKAANEKKLATWEHGAIILSYGALKTTKAYTGLINIIKAKKYEAVVLDEAHRIKNRNSANAKAAFSLGRGARYRIALTGTPVTNKPEELWSILHFLYPSRYKSYWNFVDEYCATKEMMNPITMVKFRNIVGIKPSMKQALAKNINEIATQRKRIDIMQWLPAKEYERIMLEPTKTQKQQLYELTNFFETEHITVQGILDRLIRYRQICLDPGLLELPGKSPKTEWLLDYFKDYPDRPTIIFSKFTSYIKTLQQVLKAYNPSVIIGSTSHTARLKAVDDFQQGKTNLIIINIDAGKEAITLDRGEVEIFTDKYPPIGDLEQAEDRFIATTKEKAAKPNVIYELVLEGTYDEALYKMLAARTRGVDVINNFKQYIGGGAYDCGTVAQTKI